MNSEINRALSTTIDASRWIASLLVVAQHGRSLLFSDYTQVFDQSMTWRIFYVVTGLGHQAVVIFFVISGMLVGGISLERWKANTFSYSAYAVHRFSRIFVVLIPALVLGVILDTVGLVYFNATGLYDGSNFQQPEAIDFAINSRLSLSHFLGSAVMLQPFAIDPVGSNGPLWSLSYEWWYYVTFAAMLFAARARWMKKSAVVIAILIAFFLQPLMLTWMLLWLVGVGLHFYGHSNFKKPPRAVGLVVFLCTLAMSVVFNRLVQGVQIPYAGALFISDLMVALGFSFFLASLYTKTASASGRKNENTPGWITSFNTTLADFSYSNYLLHLPFMVLFVSVLNEFGWIRSDQPSWTGVAVFLMSILATCLYTYSVSRVTEERTPVIRRWMMQRIAKRL